MPAPRSHVLKPCSEPLPAAAAASEPPLAAAMNARTLAASFATPSGPATPLDTSTIDGRATDAASATLSGFSPPASIQPLLLQHRVASTQILQSSEEAGRLHTDTSHVRVVADSRANQRRCGSACVGEVKGHLACKTGGRSARQSSALPLPPFMPSTNSQSGALRSRRSDGPPDGIDCLGPSP